MIKFELISKEPENYAIRSQKSLRTVVIVTFVVFATVCFLSKWQHGLLAAILIFLVQYRKSDNVEHYYITGIKVTSSSVDMTYKEKEVEKTISGNTDEFIFKKKIRFSRNRVSYLSIYHKNNLLVNQFEIGSWTEDKFDQLVNLNS